MLVDIEVEIYMHINSVLIFWIKIIFIQKTKKNWKQFLIRVQVRLTLYHYPSV